jgi:DUF4097 and DUF4098 domain-containing protein YvlB
MSLTTHSPRQLSRLAIAASALTIVVAGAGCIDLTGAVDAYVQSEEKRFFTTGTPDVSLSTFDGAIEIRSWDKAEVEIIIERHASSKAVLDEIEIQSQQDGNKVTVNVTAPKRSGFMGFSRSAKLIVQLPTFSNVAAKSGDGSIELARITGRLDLRTGDGSIRGRDLAGDVKAATGDGAVNLDGLDGSLDIETGDGSVALSGKLTAVRARTGDGSLAIHADPGSLTASGWDLTTGDGAITLELPPVFDAELDAHTGDGRIQIQDVPLSNRTEQNDKSTIRGQLGSGGGPVRLRTGDGSITIRHS